ncbi:PREDICTED: clustered mitochondria protein-like isoform X2 [Ipomoea nil]|uniref:clustered mitochondria protein-like isoform X2 n=1 Tax=Ipomoea nil TaxID=35883 RepID=UPI00090119AD|nr:PREDICTED: clustered mitochondria protein-like isoform X2 [Ipomoea nil]
MAGKSNKGKNRKGQNATSATEHKVPSDAPMSDCVSSEANGNAELSVSADMKTEMKESSNGAPGDQPKEGGIHLYPVTVKTQGGEKLELQLSPGDSVMDVKQFLLDAPETCFFTCYDLLLHTKDGSNYHLEDYNEISEVADITSGSCSLEMVPALYDDRSIRAHVHRTRELLSLSSLHSSLSTSLALQHESGQPTAAKSGEPIKADIPELDNMGFVDNISSSLSNLLSTIFKEVKCVESIVFSSFNPPPSYRRLAGDLIYLDVVTLEGNKYSITGTTKNFYVNSSTANVLDPRPNHTRDAARAENALTLSFGSELIGMQRDWNEELQSCREFPHGTPQERILRDRALYKVTSDFVDAATSGAIGVISRCIPPINPTDPECFHMYVHNNIFFSFAVDADLEQLSKRKTSDSLSEVEITSPIQLSSEKIPNNLPHGASEISNGEKPTASSAEHVNGMLDSAVGGPAENQLAESEQATHASANNDLKGTKAYQEADVPGLYNLAMAIIDYRGHRVVAQSVLPGILQGDKSDSLLYGSVDNGKKICWNEKFHSKVVEAAKRLHLKLHAVYDGSGNIFELAAPVECKGIVGSDDRHYILDLMRVTPRDANYSGPGSRFCILRPELITAFCQVEATDRSKSKCKAEGEVQETSDSSDANNADEIPRTEDNVPSQVDKEEKLSESNDAKECCSQSGSKDDIPEEILFNPNAFTDFKLAGNKEDIAADEELVKKVSLYLKDVVLPKFVHDLCALEVSPMDGQTLTEALHAHGINLRYLGKVAEGTRHFPHLWDLCSNEVVVRSAKHIFKDVMRDSEDHDLANAISHFFNCFFGNIQTTSNKVGTNSVHSRNQKKDHHSSGKFSKGQAKKKSAVSAVKKQSSYMNVTSDSLWSDIKEFSKQKYQFELPDDARLRVKKIPVLRNLCLKVGVTVAARKYDLDAVTPFQATDILNLQPVVKHSIPISSEAKDLVETGKAQLAEGLLNEAYLLFSEAFTILQQVTGPMHREVANCCRYLAMVLYHAGDMAGAIAQQHKELIINERCLGLDHPDTAHSYGNMALFYHGLSQTELALRHMSRALLLLGLSSGPDHPDVAATFINVAMMYQDIGKMDTALRYLQEALKKNERLLGEDHIQTAVCYHALAIAFNCISGYKVSRQHEQKTYDILVKQLGEDDPRTKDSLNWLNTFKMRELQLNAQKQRGQALNETSAHKAYDILKANPSILQAFQAATGGAGLAGVNQSLNAAMLGEALPRGRGVDERAARAAAEVRKKAAAKGLLLRPNAGAVQGLPPLSQILNVLNPGVTPDPVNRVETDGANKEANGDSTDTPADAQGDNSKPEQPDEAPVGLGSGLASLNAKKQKSKPKVTS